MLQMGEGRAELIRCAPVGRVSCAAGESRWERPVKLDAKLEQMAGGRCLVMRQRILGKGFVALIGIASSLGWQAEKTVRPSHQYGLAIVRWLGGKPYPWLLKARSTGGADDSAGLTWSDCCCLVMRSAEPGGLAG